MRTPTLDFGVYDNPQLLLASADKFRPDISSHDPPIPDPPTKRKSYSEVMGTFMRTGTLCFGSVKQKADLCIQTTAAVVKDKNIV